MTRKRKVVYPGSSKPAKGGVPVGTPTRSAGSPSNVVTIDLAAMAGRTDIRPGGRVRIAGGLHEGELAIVESIVGGIIPAVVIRLASGRTRRIRAVDLRPVDGERAGTNGPGRDV